MHIIFISFLCALPKTNSSPHKIRFPKRKGWFSNHQFSGAFAVTFKEGDISPPLFQNGDVTPIRIPRLFSRLGGPTPAQGPPPCSVTCGPTKAIVANMPAANTALGSDSQGIHFLSQLQIQVSNGNKTLR